MRHRLLSIFMLCLVALSMVAAPSRSKKNKKTDNRQYITFWGGVGYSALAHSIEDSRLIGGFGAQLGIGYEFDMKNLLLHTGLELQYIGSRTDLSNPTHANIDFNYTPMGSHPLTYHYRFSTWQEQQDALLLNIPLLVGYRFADYWYVMGGLRLGAAVMGKAKVNADCAISYSDPHMIGEITHGHYAGQYRFYSHSAMSLGFNIAPSVELGVYLDQWLPESVKVRPALGRQRNRRRVPEYLPSSFRVAIYAECNALNINTNKVQQPLLDISQMEQPDQVRVNGLSTTLPGKDLAMHNVTVGAKFTYLFSMNKAPRQRKPKKTSPEPTPIQRDTIQKIEDTITITPPPAIVVTDTLHLGEKVVQKEQAIIIQDLLFEFRTANIIPSSMKSLDALVELLYRHPNIHIMLIGHTDSIGTAAFNLRLSQQRADAVRKHLIRNGIDPSRLATDGRGATEPISTNETEEGRQLNRRVEFIITNEQQ